MSCGCPTPTAVVSLSEPFLKFWPGCQGNGTVRDVMFDMCRRRGQRKLTQIEVYDLMIGPMMVYM